MTKMYQGAKMEEIQAKSRICKYRTIRFGILDYPIFPEEIESN
jgi:hypothetical protein